MFKMYSNPEGAGWLGWIEDANGNATAYVRLDRRIVLAWELGD